MKRAACLMAALGCALASGPAAAAGWSKYISPDRSWSMHYPAGWTVRAQGTVVQLANTATKEEIMIFLVPNATRYTASSLANYMIGQFKQKIPSLAVVSRRTIKGGHVILEATMTVKRSALKGVAVIMKMGALGIWASYNCPKKRYNMQNAWGLLFGTVSTMAQGTGSRRPVVRKPAGAARRPTVSSGGSRSGGPAIDDKWFLPRGKKLRGFYGGAVRRKDLGGHVSMGVNVPGTLHYSRMDSVTSGGDFRVAFYTDGTVRAKFLMLNYTPMFSSNVAFRYVGRYKLNRSGKFKTNSMKLANRPQTMLGFEKRMTKLRLKGRFFKKQNKFRVDVETYNPLKRRWWALGKGKVLGRASRRRSTMFGTVKTPHSTTYGSGGR